MSKFLYKIFLYIGIVFLLGVSFASVFFVCIAPQYKYKYTSSIIDKIDRLKSINEPKIILVGNSNLSFGIDSEMIEEAIGMPVVNLGLHGGLGNAFHEEMAKFNIAEGDYVILAHSYYSDTNQIADYSLAWITLENNFELYQCVDVCDYWEMLCAFPDYIKNSCLLWINRTGNMLNDGAYSRTAFNEYGDISILREGLYYSFTADSIPVPEINDICTNRINEFSKYCEERGAYLLVAGYPIGNGEFTPAREEYISFQEELDRQLDCEIISDFTDYMFDYSYFYDTFLHLNDKGTELRTAQLIEDIKAWQERNAP